MLMISSCCSNLLSALWSICVVLAKDEPGGSFIEYTINPSSSFGIKAVGVMLIKKKPMAEMTANPSRAIFLFLIRNLIDRRYFAVNMSKEVLKARKKRFKSPLALSFFVAACPDVDSLPSVKAAFPSFLAGFKNKAHNAGDNVKAFMAEMII